MKKYLLATLLCLGFSTAAQASFYLEPYLGYGMGKFDSPASEFNSTDSFNRTDIGARIGYSMLGFSVGGEYATSISGKADVTGISDFKGTSMGLFVGYELPILFRVYAGYSIQSNYKYTRTGTSGDLEGKGMYLAAGYTGLPFIAINFEYHINTLNKNKSGGTDTTYNNSKADYYLVSVSLPLEL